MSASTTAPTATQIATIAEMEILAPLEATLEAVAPAADADVEVAVMVDRVEAV